MKVKVKVRVHNAAEAAVANRELGKLGATESRSTIPEWVQHVLVTESNNVIYVGGESTPNHAPGFLEIRNLGSIFRKRYRAAIRNTLGRVEPITFTLPGVGGIRADYPTGSFNPNTETLNVGCVKVGVDALRWVRDQARAPVRKASKKLPAIVVYPRSDAESRQAFANLLTIGYVCRDPENWPPDHTIIALTVRDGKHIKWVTTDPDCGKCYVVRPEEMRIMTPSQLQDPLAFKRAYAVESGDDRKTVIKRFDGVTIRVHPGSRMITVRGSCYDLDLVAQSLDQHLAQFLDSSSPDEVEDWDDEEDDWDEEE